ncbi:MAG: ArsR family transcriptional regulator [Planctomycetaceae bacterium]|nr:ArsR family transcriptional regulator [Planctomycetaceae bacterium]
MSRYPVSVVGANIMRLLIGHPPRRISELIEATGVTRTAISEQLNELITSGYVDQQIERLSGRGRPRYLYSATEFAMKQLFEGNQNLVVPAIWRAIKKHVDLEIMQQVCEEVASELAEHFNKQITSEKPAERLREFTEIICKNGRLGIVRDESGGPELDKLNCPFITMYDSSGLVCEIDKTAMRKIVGADVERVRCRAEGAPCCTFRIVNTAKLEPETGLS